MTICLTQFYKHDAFMESVKQGNDFVNNTNFNKYYKERMQAIANYNINDIVEDKNTCTQYKILSILDDTLQVISCNYLTSKGNIRKGNERHVTWLNPCHVCKV